MPGAEHEFAWLREVDFHFHVGDTLTIQFHTALLYQTIGFRNGIYNSQLRDVARPFLRLGRQAHDTLQFVKRLGSPIRCELAPTNGSAVTKYSLMLSGASRSLKIRQEIQRLLFLLRLLRGIRR